MRRRTPLAFLFALTALLAAAPLAGAAARPTTTAVLSTWETKEQAATWEKATWQETQAACEAYAMKAFPSLVCGNSVEGTRRMTPKRTYTLTVSGLIGLFSPTTALPCGAPATLPDGTPAGVDAQFEFANADAAETCYLGPGPVKWNAFLMSLDGGKTWSHPVAKDKPKAPSADHKYTFSVTVPGKGKLGKKPLFKWYDVRTADNRGTLTITYREDAAKKKPKKKASSSK